jgi:hypothetical protein
MRLQTALLTTFLVCIGLAAGACRVEPEKGFDVPVCKGLHKHMRRCGFIADSDESFCDQLGMVSGPGSQVCAAELDSVSRCAQGMQDALWVTSVKDLSSDKACKLCKAEVAKYRDCVRVAAKSMAQQPSGTSAQVTGRSEKTLSDDVARPGATVRGRAAAAH